LLAYKAYRDAATALEQRAEEWRLRAHAAAVRVSEADDDAIDEDAMDALDDLAPVDLMLEDLSLVDLVEAFRRVAETVNFERIGTHNVTYDDTPIELHAQDILDRIVREGVVALVEMRSAGEDAVRTKGEAREIEFTTIFTGRSRSEMVGLFLALLDLCRRRQVAFRHDDAGQIRVRARTEEELKDDAATVGRPDDVIG
jgi:chromatin segregation and condensation protein Rec8/ScpA/Scc1 (kleisin family)